MQAMSAGEPAMSSAVRSTSAPMLAIAPTALPS
jgi:hypothetical protein